MSGPLWAPAALAEAIGGRRVGPEAPSITGISIDSRTIAPGDAFFAIKGDRFDGHDFVGAAFAKGAAVAVVTPDRLAGFGRMTGALLVVDDVMEALRRLAVAARDRYRGKAIAVTGSVGKTTTKDMLRHALARSGTVHGAVASFNNHWGVPLTLARMPADAPFAVFEVGMNHPGEITPLTAMVRPHVAIITTIEPVHLQAFASVDEIAEAKAEIFSGVVPGGAAILNRDNGHFEKLFGLATRAGIERILSFGGDADADARLDEVVLGPTESFVRADIGGRAMSYTLGAPGAHMVMNSLAVLAAVQAVGGDLDAAGAALASFSPSKGRGERFVLSVGGGSVVLIDESYNANPASMKAALALQATVNPVDGGRRIAVLGDMLELGESEAALHAALADAVVESGIDRVYLTGQRMAALWEALPPDRRAVYAVNAAELVASLTEDLVPGDVVMVKASNGIGLGALVAALRQQFEVGAN